MKIQFVKFAKPAFPESVAFEKAYLKRIKKYSACETLTLKDQAYLNWQPPAGNVLVILDEQGEQVSSEQLAAKLATWRDDTRWRGVSFTVGPPYGFQKNFTASAHWLWCLSSLTLPGDLAWIVTLEQVYRGLSILHGSAYHHGEVAGSK